MNAGARKPCFALIYFNFKIWGLLIKRKNKKFAYRFHYKKNNNNKKRKKYLRTQVKRATPVEYMNLLRIWNLNKLMPNS